MEVKDVQLWTQQLSELKSDDESLAFHDFLVSWTDAATRLDSPDLTPYQVLSKAFDETEQTLGFLSVEWLGQMLLVIIQHWVSGDRLWESLSVWERRVVEQATALKIAELQDLAAARANDNNVMSDTPEPDLD